MRSSQEHRIRSADRRGWFSEKLGQPSGLKLSIKAGKLCACPYLKMIQVQY